MPKDPQTMMRTALAVMLMIGFAVIQQRWGGEEKPKVSSPASTREETQSTIAPEATATHGDFDFYVLSLSWSPTHCASSEGTGQEDDLQCRSGREFGFVLHGLWPQNERGWPEYCANGAPRRVSRSVMNEALKITPSTQLIQHEWEKHGTCSGLSQKDYFTSAGLAVTSVRIPKAYKQPKMPVRTSAEAVRRAFHDVNPQIGKDGMLVTCRGNRIAEVRICLDKELLPRACSRDTMKSHCGSRDARMPGVRGNWPGN